MSEYREIYSFSVSSRKELAELKIIPSQRPPAFCAQIHQLEDGSFWLFWNVGLTTTDYSKECIEFAEKNNIREEFEKSNIKYSLENLEKLPDFKNYIRQLVPVKKSQLSDDDMAIVWDFLKHDFGPSGKSDTGGLDGHRYFFKIFGDTVRSYETWCRVPDNWCPLNPFVNMIIDRAEIKHKEYYEALGGRQTGNHGQVPKYKSRCLWWPSKLAGGTKESGS